MKCSKGQTVNKNIVMEPLRNSKKILRSKYLMILRNFHRTACILLVKKLLKKRQLRADPPENIRDTLGDFLACLMHVCSYFLRVK